MTKDLLVLTVEIWCKAFDLHLVSTDPNSSYYIINYLLLSLLSIHSFIFLISFIKDSSVKQLIISLTHTKLITFFNTCEMPKTSYNLDLREYKTIYKFLDAFITLFIAIPLFFESANIIKRHPRKTQGMDETRYKWCRI